MSGNRETVISNAQTLDSRKNFDTPLADIHITRMVAIYTLRDRTASLIAARFQSVSEDGAC